MSDQHTPGALIVTLRAARRRAFRLGAVVLGALGAAILLTASGSLRAPQTSESPVVPRVQPPKPLSAQEIASRARSATVQIRALDAHHEPIAAGTGFFVGANGLLATNLHVIRGASSLQVETLAGDVYDLVYLVTSDARRDIAILKIPVDNARPLPLASDADVEVGATVYAMGNPLGQVGTFSSGLVSAQRSMEGVTLVQITAPISPGSSGGPVMNEVGEVIGVTTLMLRGGQNLNYAVPVRYIRPLAASSDAPRLYSEHPVPESEHGLVPSENRAEERHANSAGSERNSRDAIARQFRVIDSAFRVVDVTPLGGVVRGALDESESASHRGMFVPGNDYIIVGRCDEDCTDVDLQLSTLDGDVIAEDRDVDDRPLVRFHAEARSYRVRVTMSSCQQEPCAYGLRMYRTSGSSSAP